MDGILAKDPNTLTAPDMVSRATWAYKWRDHGHREMASRHFVDQELSDPDLKTACFGDPAPADPPSAGPAQDCVVDKLNEFEAELQASGTPAPERLLALKYVLHFVGDLHQPLHASDNEDRGGGEGDDRLAAPERPDWPGCGYRPAGIFHVVVSSCAPAFPGLNRARFIMSEHVAASSSG